MVYRKLIRKPWFWIAAAFLLPVAVMFIVFAALGTHPFGSYSSMYLDMNAQYVFYFEKFREIINKKQFAELNVYAGFTMSEFKELNGWREIVPEYVKDYVPVNVYMR